MVEYFQIFSKDNPSTFDEDCEHFCRLKNGVTLDNLLLRSQLERHCTGERRSPAETACYRCVFFDVLMLSSTSLTFYSTFSSVSHLIQRRSTLQTISCRWLRLQWKLQVCLRLIEDTLTSILTSLRKRRRAHHGQALRRHGESGHMGIDELSVSYNLYEITSGG